ncbi:glycosyltransferase family 2 protein [Herbaspirillum huttiense]|uniref:glycosyltransferase family 2 protein n=1 Tax=Herbaspirillum huttiense TaxID=863372 RepID=UPI0010650E61|nr:glycosyltransferase family 2 protein [Herbaspirillum huttiense]QBP73996.1 glycosyltransferase family 2 protein [Herbaspirillum huttiense]
MQTAVPDRSTAPHGQSVDSPSVAILMCTFNGSRYLDEQLDSIAEQTHSNWSLSVSDDGSTDDTLNKLVNFASTRRQQLHIQNGPRQGFAENFMSLIQQCSDEADFYAFADQDDIWEPNKLARALSAIQSQPSQRPALYFARTTYIDATGAPCGQSRLFSHQPCLRNALVQSIGGGNTMLFNRAALKQLRQFRPVSPIVSHDWWTYLLITALDGQVVYDSVSTVQYRQHGHNAAGQNITWRANLARLRKMLHGNYKKWHESHIATLHAAAPAMSPLNRRIFDDFKQARSGHLLKRLFYLRRSGVFRRPRWSQWGLYLSVLLNKL